MSLYASTTYFGDGSLIKDALKDLKRLNIKNIELGSNHKKGNDNLILDKNCNYIVHNYFPPDQKNFILNIASTSSQVQEKSINFIKNTILWCSKNGIKYYTIHPGFFAEAVSVLGRKGINRNFDLKFSKSSIKNKDRKLIIEKTIKIIGKLYVFAQGKLQLLIENQGSKTSKNLTLFDSVEELEKLKTIYSTKLKLNFNLAHAILSGIDLSDNNIFRFAYQNSPFFEISEINGKYDSHLPVFLNRGVVGKLLTKRKSFFRKKNLILELRNVQSKHLKSSLDALSELD